MSARLRGGALYGYSTRAAAVPWMRPLGCGVLAMGFAALWLASTAGRGRRLLDLALLGAIVVASNLPWLWVAWRQSHLRGALWYPLYLGGLQSLVFDFVK